MKKIARRQVFASLASGAVAAAAVAGSISTAIAETAATTSLASRWLTVGDGGQFSSIRDALAVAATAATPASPYTVFLLPGIYDHQSDRVSLTLPPYTTLVGAHRRSVEVLLPNSASVGLLISDLSGIAETTFRYSGAGAALSAAGTAKEFEVCRVNVFVETGGTGLETRSYLSRALVQDSRFVVAGTAIKMRSGGHMFVHSTEIVLVGTNTGTFHCGYNISKYARLWVFGGGVHSGYGYPEISDPYRDVVGIYCGADMTGRVHLHGFWSIVRNNQAGAGANAVNCIRMDCTSSDGRVRAIGCYLQAEAEGTGARPQTVLVTGPGRFEAHGSRVRDFGTSSSFGGLQSGVSRYTTAQNGTTIFQESGGLILLDASAGPFTLTLPSGWMLEGEQYIFKKADATVNAVTILAKGGASIEGQQWQALTKQYETLQLRYASSTWWRA